MFGAFAKAIAQLDDPKVKRVLLIGVSVALVVFASLWGGVWTLVTYTTLFEMGWLETTVDLLGGVATLLITWVLFPAVVSATVGFYLDDVAAAVEARHYPDLGEPRSQGLGESIATAMKFLCIMVVLNILMLPFLLLGPLFPLVFYSVNGYLLSREYFELVALRRMSSAAAGDARKAQGMRVFLTGVAIAILLTLPVINLIAPVVATAAMVHLFQSGPKPGTGAGFSLQS